MILAVGKWWVLQCGDGPEWPLKPWSLDFHSASSQSPNPTLVPVRGHIPRGCLSLLHPSTVPPLSSWLSEEEAKADWGKGSN